MIKIIEWETPKEIFKKYDDIFKFDIDVASTDEIIWLINIGQSKTMHFQKIGVIWFAG